MTDQGQLLEPVPETSPGASVRDFVILPRRQLYALAGCSLALTSLLLVVAFLLGKHVGIEVARLELLSGPPRHGSTVYRYHDVVLELEEPLVPHSVTDVSVAVAAPPTSPSLAPVTPALEVEEVTTEPVHPAELLKEPENPPQAGSPHKEAISVSSDTKAATPLSPRTSRGQETSPNRGGVPSYTIQIASVDQERQAEKLIQEMAKVGYEAYWTQYQHEGKTYFRVRIGRYEEKEEAERMRTAIARHIRHEPFVAEYE
ncbi:MAG: hypothetical protein A2284_13065 [Deltaproteobacteria bacterium RIFOXYA12_FULL_61_11]|nr:MAG: hypothetical protein A2284_13065 [Deltaproteobacteria bacterium RIFOXYA12_FULL_61_11]